MNKLVLTNGISYVGIAILTPWGTFLTSTTEATPRNLAAVAVFSIAAGLTALKAYTSTTVSDANPKP